MTSPELFRVIQIPLSLLVDCDYRLDIEEEKLPYYLVRQGDCALFNQIRRIRGEVWERDFIIRDIIFGDCGAILKDRDIATAIVKQGIIFNRQHYMVGDRSASMKRNGICSFVNSEIFFELDSALTMGIDTSNEVVYSKWTSYRGLYLSSGHIIHE